jgi:hypothetical protein
MSTGLESESLVSFNTRRRRRAWDADSCNFLCTGQNDEPLTPLESPGEKQKVEAARSRTRDLPIPAIVL